MADFPVTVTFTDTGSVIKFRVQPFRVVINQSAGERVVKWQLQGGTAGAKFNDDNPKGIDFSVKSPTWPYPPQKVTDTVWEMRFPTEPPYGVFEYTINILYNNQLFEYDPEADNRPPGGGFEVRHPGQPGQPGQPGKPGPQGER
jgi:hypothetical protein